MNLDKGTALAELLDELRMAHALYGGDDRTDIDAFRRLRELKAAGELDSAVCVGITSDEGPSELAEEADVLVEGRWASSTCSARSGFPRCCSRIYSALPCCSSPPRRQCSAPSLS